VVDLAKVARLVRSRPVVAGMGGYSPDERAAELVCWEATSKSHVQPYWRAPAALAWRRAAWVWRLAVSPARRSTPSVGRAERGDEVQAEGRAGRRSRSRENRRPTGRIRARVEAHFGLEPTSGFSSHRASTHARRDGAPIVRSRRARDRRQSSRDARNPERGAPELRVAPTPSYLAGAGLWVSRQRHERTEAVREVPDRGACRHGGASDAE
jgi:hypothetical protein